MVPSQASWSKMDSSRPPNKWARPHSPPILDRYRYEEIFYLKNAAWCLPIYGISQYTYHLWKSKAISRIKGSQLKVFLRRVTRRVSMTVLLRRLASFFLKKVPNRKVLSDTNWNGFSCRQKQQWSHYYFFISAPNANDSTDDVDYDFQPSLFQTPRRAVLEVAWEGTHSKDVMWSSHFLSDWVELHHHHSHSHHWRDQCHLL